MSTSNPNKHPSQRRYPAELRERAVRMVREATAEGGESFGVVTRVARQLGIGPESLRNWVLPARLDEHVASLVMDAFGEMNVGTTLSASEFATASCL